MVSWMTILACLMPTNDALPPWDPKTKNPLNQWMGSIPIADFSAIDIVDGQQGGTRLPKTWA
jgi:hypothetical protein